MAEKKTHTHTNTLTSKRKIKQNVMQKIIIETQRISVS